MKRLLIIASLAALGGCATQQGTTTGAAAYAQPADPHQWHVVSVTPVNLPPGAPRPANVTSQPLPAPVYSSDVTYSSVPVYPVAPGYQMVPVYPAPVFVEPYYPPFTFSLGFMFGHHAHFGGRYNWYPRRGYGPHRH